MSRNPLIQLDSVGRRYPQEESWALQGVTLEIERGSFIALMGPSGCGKSTLLNLLGAIDTPSVGTLRFDGVDFGGLSDAALTRLRAEKMGYVFQFFNLLSTLTVRENIALPLELNRWSGAQVRQRVDSLLEQVGLMPRQHHYPAQLSGGEMQRVAIVRALANRPQLILADEPTGNLDTENGAKVMDLLRTLGREEGCTLIMATHSSEAAALADRILRLRDGRLLLEESLSVSGSNR
jgi:putative ABC transport system ATP-binding protein